MPSVDDEPGLDMRLALAVPLIALPVLASGDQPLGFSHNVHIEKARMQCVDCHTGAVNRDRAGIPSISKCMLCHQFIGTDLPEVERLTSYWERRHEVPWVRVYGFRQEAAVQFRHAPHARAEIACSRCHGEVAAMSVAVSTVEHNMGTCVTCHRENGASDDCLTCHF